MKSYKGMDIKQILNTILNDKPKGILARIEDRTSKINKALGR